MPKKSSSFRWKELKAIMVKKYGDDLNDIMILNCPRVIKVFDDAFKQLEYCATECKKSDNCMKEVGIFIEKYGKNMNKKRCKNASSRSK